MDSQLVRPPKGRGLNCTQFETPQSISARLEERPLLNEEWVGCTIRWVLKGVDPGSKLGCVLTVFSCDALQA